MLPSHRSFAAGIGDHFFMPKLQRRWVGWLGLAGLTISGPLSAADSPRITVPVPVPRIQPPSRPPLPPPNVDAGRGAMPARVPQTPRDSSKASAPQPHKRASRTAPSGGGGIEGASIAGGGGLSNVPNGGGGLDAQALLGAPKGTPR